jgi:hypothetical protein
VLALLLDEHISPAVAEEFRKRTKNASILALAEWEDGQFLGVSDEVILTQAAVQKLTFVTYDRKTIPPVLKSWAEAGRDHGGVVFVDEKTIPPSDIGGLIAALQKLVRDSARTDMTSAVIFLQRQKRR